MFSQFAPRLLVLSLFCVALLSLACDGDGSPLGKGDAEKPRIFIVHSYDNGFRWSAEQSDGIIAGLDQGSYAEDEIEVRVFYMDTRVNFVTQEQIALRAGIALRTIDEFEPDVVLLTDDLAVEEVAVPYLRDHPDSDISFIFSGVNGDPRLFAPVKSLEAPGAGLTGAVERIPFIEAFEAAVRVFGPMESVVIFADDSIASTIVADAFRKSLSVDGVRYPLQVLDFIQFNNFEEWKQKTSEYRGRADAIAVLNYHRVRDQNGNIVPPKDVAKWTVEHSDLPVFGLISDWSADGFVMSFGNSGFDTGVFIGRRAADVLSGLEAGQMPIVNPEQYEMTFNLTTIEKLDAVIPQAELDRAAEEFR